MVEEAARIWRKLGVLSDLASALTNASNLYSDMARLERTWRGRRGWLECALGAVEEAVRIWRELGLQKDLAGALTNASNFYSEMAGFERIPGNRRGWLERALTAVEEAVLLCRELGVQAQLALSLGAAAQHYRLAAELEESPSAATHRLAQSLHAIREAVPLFREVGEQHYYLYALRDSVIALLMLVANGEEVDLLELDALCDEGLRVAQVLEDTEPLALFQQSKRAAAKMKLVRDESL